MREIKFRAKALTGELVYFSLHDSHLSGDPDIVFYVGGIPCEIGSEQEYTGLPDKNGKEIYEGDWIETPAGIGDVVWDNCYYIRWNPNDMTTLHDCQQGHLEVIGNIYENPELLK